jgi:hypothetical protein
MPSGHSRKNPLSIASVATLLMFARMSDAAPLATGTDSAVADTSSGDSSGAPDAAQQFCESWLRTNPRGWHTDVPNHEGTVCARNPGRSVEATTDKSKIDKAKGFTEFFKDQRAKSRREADKRMHQIHMHGTYPCIGQPRK